MTIHHSEFIITESAEEPGIYLVMHQDIDKAIQTHLTVRPQIKIQAESQAKAKRLIKHMIANRKLQVVDDPILTAKPKPLLRAMK